MGFVPFLKRQTPLLSHPYLPGNRQHLQVHQHQQLNAPSQRSRPSFRLSSSSAPELPTANVEQDHHHPGEFRLGESIVSHSSPLPTILITSTALSAPRLQPFENLAVPREYLNTCLFRLSHFGHQLTRPPRPGGSTFHPSFDFCPLTILQTLNHKSLRPHAHLDTEVLTPTAPAGGKRAGSRATRRARRRAMPARARALPRGPWTRRRACRRLFCDLQRDGSRTTHTHTAIFCFSCGSVLRAV